MREWKRSSDLAGSVPLRLTRALAKDMTRFVCAQKELSPGQGSGLKQGDAKTNRDRMAWYQRHEEVRFAGYLPGG
jgi:hypothetical protein